jgi:hypothetical protein
MAAAGALTLLKVLASLPETLRAAKAGSLVEYTKSTRVEPIVLMDRNVSMLPYATNILYSGSYAVSAYYLQAIALSVKVGKIDPVALLDKLNPSRDASENAAQSLAGIFNHGIEGYQGRLPSFAQKTTLVTSMESFSNDVADAYKKERARDNKNRTTMSPSADIAKEINQAQNLSVGVMLNVELESDGSRAKIPVNVRLITSPVAPSTIVNIIGQATGVEKDTTERYYNWTAGQLATIRDMIFCQDLADKHRNTLIEDKSGIYKEMNRRKSQNKLSTMLSLGKRPSVATASNILIITKETANEIEAALGGRLTNERIRDKIFEATMLMLIYVVDTRYEMLTMYTRSIALPSEIPIKSLKSNDKKAPDMLEMFNALRAGQPPRF